MVCKIALLLLIFIARASNASKNMQTYIVHMDKAMMTTLDQSPDNSKEWYKSVIESITELSAEEKRESEQPSSPQLIHVYKRAISGFAAKLSTKQLESLKRLDGFLSATPDEMLSLHTTRSPQFLGLELGKGLWSASYLESDVIMGVVDSGIWPEHVSFDDEGMPPVPTRWKGPSSSTVSNTAPWIMTVAASYLDRSFETTVKLGDGQTFEGSSLYVGKATNQLPLVYANSAGDISASYCVDGSLKKKIVKGKIVVCQRGVNSRAAKGEQVKLAGGAGMLMINTDREGEELFADAHILPATSLGATAGKAIKNYLNSTKKPTASIIFKGTVYGKPAPLMAAFSSRGPNEIALFEGKSFTCPKGSTMQPGDLNYPSFAVNFKQNSQTNSVTFKRTVTHVGIPDVTYAVQKNEPNGVSMVIEPQILKFEKPGQKLSYKITFTQNKGSTLQDSSFGSIEWVYSDMYHVRSSVAVTWT
ncbi:hypothetical protein V6N11_041811 [Hibiscus sabdariffa]|uniref:Uncharacterized protein n=1 Tax=Hibiscus sabdariffa TaxID=183260 RepID=A0ABR2RLN2_9ROSI